MTVSHQPQTDLLNLKSLVKQGEGINLEFKLKSNHPEKIVREVVAFANAKGGKLIIGISDDKEIKGLKYVDEDEYIITKSIEKHVFPKVEFTIQKIKVDSDKDVLVYNIRASENKPHFLDITGLPEDRKVYMRVADKAVQASKELREILKSQNKQKSFRFNYGDKERDLMRYLDSNPTISLKQFAETANIVPKVASRTLILLVLAGVLKILPNEIEDKYALA